MTETLVVKASKMAKLLIGNPNYDFIYSLITPSFH